MKDSIYRLSSHCTRRVILGSVDNCFFGCKCRSLYPVFRLNSSNRSHYSPRSTEKLGKLSPFSLRKSKCQQALYAIFVLFGCFSYRSCFAWSDAGHRVVALIAYDQLSKPEKNYVNALIHALDPYYPKMSTFDRAAIWADKIKQRDIHRYDSWHFINLPLAPANAQRFFLEPHNVVWAIEQSRAILKSTQASRLEQALSLRFLIHLIGDIHQPLHCIQRYSARFPDGDRGGNLYKIRVYPRGNLHAYWDGGLGRLVGLHSHRDLSRVAKKIEMTMPKENFILLLKESDPNSWARESYQIARDFVYSTPINSKPTKHYIQKGREVVAKQLALAGYRLAQEIKTIVAEELKKAKD